MITALITALVIGIGLDYTIHVTHRFVEEIERNDKISEAVNATMRTTGGALLGSALTTALGFLVLVFSPIAPIDRTVRSAHRHHGHVLADRGGDGPAADAGDMGRLPRLAQRPLQFLTRHPRQHHQHPAGEARLGPRLPPGRAA